VVPPTVSNCRALNAQKNSALLTPNYNRQCVSKPTSR